MALNNVLQVFEQYSVDNYTLVVGLGSGYILWKLWQLLTEKRPNSPSICWSWPFDTIDFVRNAPARLRAGYNKYSATSGSFKVSYMGRWIVLVTGKLVDELRQAPEGQLSFSAAMDDNFQTKYTFGPNFSSQRNHTRVLKLHLTRNLPNLAPDMMDELIAAVEEELQVKPGKEWTKVKARPALMRVLSRTSNRSFVGLPICRAPEYRDLNINFTLDVLIASRMINLFPKFLHPIAGRIFTRVGKAVKTGSKYIGPLIVEREKMDPSSRPNDALTWLMNEAEGEEKTVEALTLRLLGVNFAAIHTTSAALTHALYHLAARPEYLLPLREEIDAIIGEDGWTKVAVGKMRTLDSFIKESIRVTGLSAMVMVRKAMVDFTYSDGTFVPKGHYTCTPLQAAHLDEARYENGSIFDGFRFIDAKEEVGSKHNEGDGSSRSQITSTSLDFLPFGYGHHACPGRFFAALELKCAIAYLITQYDIKMENEGVRPADEWFGGQCLPNRFAEVLFRKRSD